MAPPAAQEVKALDPAQVERVKKNLGVLRACATSAALLTREQVQCSRSWRQRAGCSERAAGCTSSVCAPLAAAAPGPSVHVRAGGLLNHSCIPNVTLSKPDHCYDDTTVVVARRPITKGEEILISYVDEKLPFQARRDALGYYGFECKCPKCVKVGPMRNVCRHSMVHYALWLRTGRTSCCSR